LATFSSSFDLELCYMTITFELDLDNA